MSKESSVAYDCPGGCGLRITFVEQHMPHCQGPTVHPNVLRRKVGEVIDKLLGAEKLHSEAKVEERQTKRRHNRKRLTK